MKKTNRFLKTISLLLVLSLLVLAGGCGNSADSASSNADSEVNTFDGGSAAAETAQNPDNAGGAEGAENTGNGASPAASVAEETGAQASEAPAEEGTPLAPAEPVIVLPAMEMPYAADEGRILVNTLFQSSMPNPDCDNASGENIATLELVNQSGMFLDSASFVVTLTDGTVLNFAAEAIPADAVVWAFELANQVIETQAEVAEIVCNAYYADGDQLMEGQLEIATDAILATVTNISDEPISGLNAEFHCLFDGVIFGGLTIKYHLDEIPAGATSTLTVDEAWLGEAAAVRMTAGGY